MNRFAEVLAILLLCDSRKPRLSLVYRCRRSRSQCGTWGYGEIQKVVLLTISSCSTYVECLEMTYGNMMAGAGCTMGGRLEGQEGGLGGLFGAWAGNVE